MTNGDQTKPDDPKGLMLAIDDLKSTILEKLKGKDPWWWRIVQLILPVVLTSLLGLVVWNVQSSIQRELDKGASRLQAQLGLTQHLYEKRLAAYKELYDKVLAVYLSLRDVKTSGSKVPVAKRHLHDNLRILSELRSANKIIASRELNTLLLTTWLDISKGKTEMVAEDIMKQIEDQMRKDLLVDKLSPEGVLWGAG